MPVAKTPTAHCLMFVKKMRDVSGLSVGVIPAAASSGRVSSKIRPFERASVMPFKVMICLSKK